MDRTSKRILPVFRKKQNGKRKSIAREKWRRKFWPSNGYNTGSAYYAIAGIRYNSTATISNSYFTALHGIWMRGSVKSIRKYRKK